MRYTKPIALFLLLGWLILTTSPHLGLTASPGDDNFDKAVLRKIEPQALKQLQAAKDGQASFIVEFTGKPNLSNVRRQIDKTERRKEMVQALQATATQSQRAALDDLKQRKQKGEVETYNSLWIINGVSVKANRQTLFALAARPEVQIIKADRRHYLNLPAGAAAGGMLELPVESQVTPTGVEWNISKIRADLVWSALGIDGTGAVVASLDTGVDWQHPALLNKYRGYSGKGIANHIGNWYDAVPPNAYQYPVDGYGHGTHVTGIMVGSDETNQVGVAPGAKWIAAKVFTDGSNPYADDSWIHAAFQWVIAPAGDPSLAPDVVNCSWGSSDPSDQAFKPDIEALLAASIIPVFAAGNNGTSGSSSVNSPASLAEAFSVGATDSADSIAYFSSRGPSPWGQIKPEVSAPGVSIRSTYFGGSYVYMSGTSMATPHVAGLLALLKQASPGLTTLQALSVITSTAQPLGAGQPNNDYGWGRIDAYAAVSQVMQAGVLTGVVRDSRGVPLPGAVVTATSQTTGAQTAAASDQNGAYSIALGVGVYDAKAGAFGYFDSAVLRVAIDPQSYLVRDLYLEKRPSGLLTGLVLEAGTNLPLMATVTVLGTPVSVATRPDSGAYTLTLPSGVYDVNVTSDRHRTQTQKGITIGIDTTSTANFALAQAPRILLVDSGAWYSESEIGYFSSALDQLNYAYSIRPITDTRFIPTLAELSPFDIVLWSSPLDSPGYLGADADLAKYLDGGGKLFLTGQDVGYYDGSGASLIYAPYFSDHLHAKFVSDNAGMTHLAGLDSGIFAGITLTLNTADSAQNQLYPDVIAADGPHAAAAINYPNGALGGIATDVCLPFRALYLSFGLEGAGPAANRVALIDRAIDWLIASPPMRELRLLPESQSQIIEPGKVATSTITVWNTGLSSDSFAATTSNGLWNASLWDGIFSYPLTGATAITSCQALTIGVKVDVPPDVGKNVAASTVVTVTSVADPVIQSAAMVTVKTPAFILLVDDDRWYDVESYYEKALNALGYAYDVFDTQDGEGPGLSTLSMYSVTIWFTGYDWYMPLSRQDEKNLAAYLDQGGRLFLSSQDYLYVSGLDDFGTNYLGIFSYTNDMTATRVTGIPGDPVGDGLGPYSLTMPYEGFKDWSDELTPKPPASASFLNIFGVPTGIDNLDGGGWGRTVFFAFPFEGLDSQAAQRVLDRVVKRALATDVKANQRITKPASELQYEMSVFNAGSQAASWVITSAIPAQTTFVTGSLEGGASYDTGGNQVRWQGVVAPGETKLLAYRVTVLGDLGKTVVNTTNLELVGDGAFTRTVTTPIGFVVYLPVVTSGFAGGW